MCGAYRSLPCCKALSSADRLTHMWVRSEDNDPLDILILMQVKML